MTDEGIWSAAVKRPLDVNSLNVAGIDGGSIGADRAHADDWRIVQGMAGLLSLQSDSVAYAPAVSARSVSMTVRNGDTMSGIARRTGLWPLSA